LVKALLNVEIVDLRAVTVADLADLWQHEAHFWRHQLLWDVSGTFAALRRILGRGGLPGKAVRVDGQMVGYACYGIAGHLGVISHLVVSPDWSNTHVGEILLKAIIDELRRMGVTRIESRVVSNDAGRLVPAFESEGFRTYWRDCLRYDLRQAQRPVHPPVLVVLEPWPETNPGEAAPILQQAYAGGVEAEIDEQYRSVDGCHVVLDHILHQGSCGILVAEASAMARHRGRGIGFVLVTEVAPRQGHLTQIIVHPQFQRRGVGRGLLDYSLQGLVERRFDTLSLFVSRSNLGAHDLYERRGFQSVFAFPTFVWGS
jgi:ribosomal protein S18 acetylase RimI-like enzyme